MKTSLEIYARISKKTLFKRIIPYFIVIINSKELLNQFVGVSWVLALDTSNWSSCTLMAHCCS